MSSSISPDRREGTPGVVSSGGEDQDHAGPSSLSPDVLKTLQERRTTQDENPPKKRGPKPNSKPALTRRQELNRQAQRTHRERKELYIKALEDEVLRLKEVFSNVSNDKEQLAEENRQLKDMLAQKAVLQESPGFTASSSSQYAASSNVYTPSFHPQSGVPSVSSSRTHVSNNMQLMSDQQPQDMTQQGSNQMDVDVEQSGIDFVLTLERPCMEHIPFLLKRAAALGTKPSGHALMATCPPGPTLGLRPDFPFGHTHVSGGAASQLQTWEPSKTDLAKLLDLSKRLDLDGQVTPVMAWGIFLAHPRFYQLGPPQFQRLAEELGQKVRCYGFGAVLEEFEVRDALSSLFA